MYVRLPAVPCTYDISNLRAVGCLSCETFRSGQRETLQRNRTGAFSNHLQRLKLTEMPSSNKTQNKWSSSPTYRMSIRLYKDCPLCSLSYRILENYLKAQYQVS